MYRSMIILFFLMGCVTRPDHVDFSRLDEKPTSLAFTAILKAKENSCFVTFYNKSINQFIQIEVSKDKQVYAVSVSPGIYWISELDCDQNLFFWKSDARLLSKIYVKPGFINYLGNLELEMKEFGISGIPDQYSIGISFKENIHQTFLKAIPRKIHKRIYWGFSGRPLSKERPNNSI